MILHSRQYSEGNGPWHCWGTKGPRACDSDRIGWHYNYLDTEKVLPLIEKWTGHTNAQIVGVYCWNNASSGHPGFTIFYK
jgi:hypothetical protein